MKLFDIYVKMMLLLVLGAFVISIHRLYRLQVSSHLTSARKYLWTDSTRFLSIVNVTTYSSLQEVSHNVSNTDSASTQSLTTKFVSNTISMTTNEALTAVQSERKQPPVEPQIIPRASSYGQLVIPVKVLKQNLNVCRSAGLQYIFYVHSAVSHFAKRHTVRQTWGNKNLFKDHRTAILFLIGTTNDPGVQRRLDAEFKRFGDLVQGDFIDDYRNMTQKAILGIQYISGHCSHIPHAIKADDDVMVDIFRVMSMVNSQKHHDFVICYHWHDMNILRTHKKDWQTERWGIPDYLFPGQLFYPPYCAGLGYVIKTKLLGQMYKHVKSIPYIHVDDVFTGQLMNTLSNVEFVDLLKEFPYGSFLGYKTYFAPEKKPYFLFTIFYGDNQKLWKKVLRYLDEEVRDTLNVTNLENL